jgi:hypothetical protein
LHQGTQFSFIIKRNNAPRGKNSKTMDDGHQRWHLQQRRVTRGRCCGINVQIRARERGCSRDEGVQPRRQESLRGLSDQPSCSEENHCQQEEGFDRDDAGYPIVTKISIKAIDLNHGLQNLINDSRLCFTNSDIVTRLIK